MGVCQVKKLIRRLEPTFGRTTGSEIDEKLGLGIAGSPRIHLAPQKLGDCQTTDVGSDDNHRIRVCSDDPIFGPALRRSLENFDVEVTGMGTDLGNPAPHLIVWHQIGTDIDAGLTSLVQRIPTVIVAPDDLLTACVELGCRGFVSSDASANEMVEAIQTVADGGAYVSARLLGSLLRRLVDRRRGSDEALAKLEGLTAREMEVFLLAARGIGREPIAAQLFISSDTVRTHLQRVYRKLDVHTHAELVAFAWQTRQVSTAVEG